MTDRVTVVDGREIRWRTAGFGPVTVVLEAGLTASASQWTPILPRLAEQGRVVAVSRAGYGGSTPVGRRSAHTSVADLAAVLDEVEGPLVLVGHSWGGMLCRLYAAQHPERVVGLVLVDASHEGIAAMRKPAWRVLAGVGTRLTTRRARSGRLRADLESGAGPYASAVASMPVEARPALINEMASPETWRQARRDIGGVQLLLREVHERPLPVPGVPVVAVLGGRAEGKGRRSRALITEVYERWLPTLPDGRLVIAPNSGHLVPHEDEALLAQVIEDLVAEAAGLISTVE